jgi:hypothetical protein
MAAIILAMAALFSEVNETLREHATSAVATQIRAAANSVEPG